MTYFEPILVSILVIGYLFIVFEHNIKLDKTASALITGVACWTFYIITHANIEVINQELMHHLSEIASILFFLMGAMTIVELIGGYGGFDYIKHILKTKSKPRLLIILSILTFFLSAILDNLTTAIAMTTIIQRLLDDKKDRLFFSGIVVILANAGGAWSPLGDVTTTMLWIGGQVTALGVMKNLWLPSLVAGLIPVVIAAYKYKGQTIMIKDKSANVSPPAEQLVQGRNMLLLGMGLLLFVPIFKTLTGLPPFMGMMLSLGFIWIITAILHWKEKTATSEKSKTHISVIEALQKADLTSILFLLGILLAIGALQSTGVLKMAAVLLDKYLHNMYLVGTSLGLLSALVDNVPLVSACQKMYELNQYPIDHPFWHFLALTTGTGGSAIIIGSAAGVAVMGKMEMDFVWYLVRISWLALIGLAGSILVFLLLNT